MINTIFDQLASNSSRNFKIDLLTKHKDNDLLKRVCFLALDPFTQFYIRKIPSYKPAPANLASSLEISLDGLSLLSSRKITGNAAIEYLADLLGNLTAEDAKVVERIIEKDLKCGVSESTVNKVWPGLAFEYPCMLASAYDEKLISKMKWPAYVQLKADGVRFNAIVKDGSVEFRSRNGKLIQIADPEFALPFIEMAEGVDLVFDGELLVVDDNSILDRKTGNGIISKAIKGTQSEAEGKMVRTQLWDWVRLEDFRKGKCNIPYQTRLYELTEALRTVDTDRVSIIPTETCRSFEEALVVFRRYYDQDLEGAIIKATDMIWENKRSKQQIKLKGELECDLKVVDWVEGTGKHQGRLGALIVESSDGKVRTGLGTGYTDDDRTSITKDVVGKIVAVKYNARISDKKSDVDSLFLPVFVCVREDKDQADSSDDIK